MTMYKSSLPLFLAIALGGSADAGAASPKFDSCMKNASANAEMMSCVQEESARLDKELNANYRKLTATLTPERKRALVKAQRAWLAFRDANCAFYFDPDGGSMAALLARDCNMKALAARNAELIDFLQSN